MKVKLTDRAIAAGMLDPHTKRSPFINPETKGVLEVADVPDNIHWRRRMLAGELELVADAEPVVEETASPVAAAEPSPLATPPPALTNERAQSTPTGLEPVKPLTTRD